jgi:hypothetical protein
MTEYFKRLFAYRVNPIDFGFELMPTVEEHMARLQRQKTYHQSFAHSPYEGSHADCSRPEAFAAFLSLGRKAALTVDWDGDVRDHMHVFFVPGDNKMHAAIIWKQENNGDTFVVSPIPLPHLQELCSSFDHFKEYRP